MLTKSKGNFILNILSDTSFFRIAYIIDLFFASVVFLEVPSLVFRCIILTWGLFLLINKFIYSGNIFKIKYNKIILAFIASNILTVVIHIVDNFLPNIVSVYHIVVCLIMFYGMYAEKSRDKLEKEMLIIFKAIVLITTVLSFAGLVLFMFKAQIKLGDFWIGINNNRFTGLYINSNMLAFSCVVAIIFANVLIKFYNNNNEGKTIFNITFLLISISLNFLSLLLSDSNASFLFIIIYLIVLGFYYLFKVQNNIGTRNIIQKSVILLLFGVSLILVSFAIRGFCQNGISVIVNDFTKIKHPSYDNQAGVAIGRENYDITYGSGRSVLLVQGLELFRYHPILGIGRGNLLNYGAQYLEKGLKYNDLHNGYLTVLVCSGIIGFSIFFCFGICVAVKMCKYLFKSRYEYEINVFPNLFAAIIGYCVYSLFEKTIFTEITFMVMAFWLILGYAMSYMRNYIDEESESMQYDKHS